jgi:tetratricopeptide (TPR) repeat protein
VSRNGLVSYALVCLVLCACVYRSQSLFAQLANSSHASSGDPARQVMPHLGKAFELLGQNRYPEAAREFREALAIDPRLTMRARFPLAVCLFAMGSQEEARKQFEAVRGVAGDTPEVMYYLGRLDLMAERYDSAIGALQIAAGHPPFPDTDYFLGYAYLKVHRLAQAETWLRKAAASAPGDFRIQERLGLLYRLAGRGKEAQQAFARAAELHRRDVEANQEALECMQALQTRPVLEARPVCQNLFHPGNLGDLVSLGTIYGDHGDYQEALEPFRRAAQLDPNSFEMQYNIGLTYFRLKRYREAREPLMRAVALRPDIFKLNALLGAVLYTLGEDVQAHQFLSHAHELNPEDKSTAALLFQEDLLLARRTFLRNQYQASVRYLAQATIIQPSNPQPHQLLSQVYAAMGKPDEAHREDLEAIRLGAGRP